MLIGFALSFIVLLGLGVPISIGLGGAAMVYNLLHPTLSLTMLVQTTFGGMSSFPLLAIPLFMLAGSIMETGGISRQLIDFSDSIVGWVPGGLACAVIVAATFRAPPGDPATLAARMDDQLAKRDASQPTRDRSAGSTFRNPLGRSSTGAADDSHELKAWKVIADAGMRGARLGAAQMSDMHANFLINTGGASAADLEELGEQVRKRVFQHSGITLEWEIMRVGEPAAK